MTLPSIPRLFFFHSRTHDPAFPTGNWEQWEEWRNQGFLR